MARAIDCEIAKKRLQAWIDESEAQGFEEAARNFRDCISLLDAVPTLTPPNEWVSVEERLPEEKQRVIVRCECVGTSVGWILWGNWMTDIGPGAGKVTHWMLLPAPPCRRPPEGEEEA